MVFVSIVALMAEIAHYLTIKRSTGMSYAFVKGEASREPGCVCVDILWISNFSLGIMTAIINNWIG